VSGVLSKGAEAPGEAVMRTVAAHGNSIRSAT
jgi:hypothetical protein